MELPAELALSIEDLSKRVTDVHELRYTPTLSVAQKLRHRREGIRLPAPSNFGDDIGDDDDDDAGDDGDDGDDELEEEVGSEPRTASGEWVLRDIDFELARGEALAVVGDAASVSALSRIVTGTTAPTSGRVVYRGRIGLSAEFARQLARRDMIDPPMALRNLARVAGVPRRARKAWYRAAIELLSDARGHGGAIYSEDPAMNVPIAVTFDPFADVLVIDRLPGPSDAAFLQRCAERLQDCLQGGAAAFVACDDVAPLADVCTRAVWLKDGQVARVGETAEVVAAAQEDARARERVASTGPRPFNDDAAILSAGLAGDDVGRDQEPAAAEDVEIVARLETTHADTSVSWRVLLAGPTDGVTSIGETGAARLGAPGSYVFALHLPPSTYEQQVDALSVLADVRVGGRRTVLGRTVHGFRGAPSSTAEPAAARDGLITDWWPAEETEAAPG